MEYPFKDLLPLDEVLEREGYYKDWSHLDPEVFYSLTQISEYIKTKGYGVDVRLLIAQLAEHFGLKTTQVVDLGNLIQAEHATLKQQVQQAVAQVNADRNALETQFNQSVAQMEAEKNIIIANATVDSEVILARGGKATLGQRLDETTAQLVEINQLDNSNEELIYGTELLDGTGWTSEGWTGNFATGFTHVVGQSLPIKKTLNNVGTKLYKVEITATPSSQVGLGISDFTITLGGSLPFETYRGSYASKKFVFGIKAKGLNNDLIITPLSTYNGTFSDISVKEISGNLDGNLKVKDSLGNVAFEMRPTRENQYNLYLGKDAGKYNLIDVAFTGGGDSNVGIGARAMEFNTSGYWNVGVGMDALRSNTVGSRNIGLGYMALGANTGGDRNVAIGTFALHKNTNGRNNIALGADTMMSPQQSNHNIAMGLSTMTSAIDADFNVGIGIRSLSRVQGDGNVALGYQTLERSVNAERNVAIGSSALTNANGNENVSIGSGSASAASGTITRNVLLGYNTGRTLTTGANYNIIIGASSGGTLTSGASNILIGYNVQAPTPTTSNHLNIGGVLFGNLTAKRFGVNVDAPTARLHLSGGLNANGGAPLKINSGSLMGTSEAGALEYNGTNLYFTTDDGVRHTISWT